MNNFSVVFEKLETVYFVKIKRIKFLGKSQIIYKHRHRAYSKFFIIFSVKILSLQNIQWLI